MGRRGGAPSTTTMVDYERAVSRSESSPGRERVSGRQGEEVDALGFYL